MLVFYFCDDISCDYGIHERSGDTLFDIHENWLWRAGPNECLWHVPTTTLCPW